MRRNDQVGAIATVLAVEPFDEFSAIGRAIAETNLIKELHVDRGCTRGAHQPVTKTLIDLLDVRLVGVVERDQQDGRTTRLNLNNTRCNQQQDKCCVQGSQPGRVSSPDANRTSSVRDVTTCRECRGGRRKAVRHKLDQ